MLRETLSEKGIAVERDFHWRGGEITRIEGFSDAVFAFAITLLVVSLEVPKTFNELLEVMRGFVAFAICFALLAYVWYNHYIFFRRYGLQDSFTTLLNVILLFVVLFYVYPLKFLFSLVTNQILGYSTEVRLADGSVEPAIEPSQSSTLFVIYGLGFVAVFLVFALLFYHAYRKRAELGLTELEVLDTVGSLQAHVVYTLVGALSIAIALVAGEKYVGWAGWVYFLLAPLRMIPASTIGFRKRKARERIAATASRRPVVGSPKVSGRRPR